MTRTASLVSLFAVIGISIVLGMLLGSSFNAPPAMLAAPAPAPETADWLDQPAVRPAVTRAVDFADIVETAMPAVVAVRNTTIVRRDGDDDDPSDEPLFRFFFDNRRRPQDQRSEGFGSGFIVSPDGHILTNHHVVNGATRIEIEMRDGEKHKAMLIGSDPSIDMALLKIETDEALPTLPLGDSRDLRVGEWVVAIGNPLGLEHTVTAGVVSAKSRSLNGIGAVIPGVASFIQTDAAINRGNSGGPLLDTRGQVVGINTAISREDPSGVLVEGVGFALPINVARDAVDQLLQYGSVKRGFLGVTMNLDDIDEAAADYLGLPDNDGVLITDVMSGGPAERAGVRTGDVIRKVDGEAVNGRVGLLSKIATRRPGDRVELELYRQGRPKEISVQLMERGEGLVASGGERPEEPEEPAEPETAESEGLGIVVEGVSDEEIEMLGIAGQVDGGVRVTDVDVSSTAAEKLLNRSLITAINDVEVHSLRDWNRITDKLKPGASVKLETWLPSPGGQAQRRLVFLRVGED